MGHKNYSKYSNNLNNEKTESEVVVEPEVVVEVENNTMEEVFNEIIEEVITDPVNEEVKGYVINCNKLNVRENPEADSEVLCVIDKTAEVIVDLDNSTNTFFKVCTSSGVEGYCMKQFIAVK